MIDKKEEEKNKTEENRAQFWTIVLRTKKINEIVNKVGGGRTAVTKMKNLY